MSINKYFQNKQMGNYFCVLKLFSLQYSVEVLSTSNLVQIIQDKFTFM